MGWMQSYRVNSVIERHHELVLDGVKSGSSSSMRPLVSLGVMTIWSDGTWQRFAFGCSGSVASAMSRLKGGYWCGSKSRSETLGSRLTMFKYA